MAQTRKVPSYVSRCSVCGEAGPSYRIDKEHDDTAKYPGVYNRTLCYQDPLRSVCHAFVCYKDECYNFALLNPNFYWC